MASRTVTAGMPRSNARIAGLAVAWVVRMLDRLNGVEHVARERALGVSAWDMHLAFRPMVM